MQIIEPSYEIKPFDAQAMLENLERIARTCYKSEQKGEPGKFIQGIIRRGHEAMIEHEYITVRFIHNRGFTHELVRHRIANFAQESTRYCNYSADKFGNELTFIKPYWHGIISDYNPYEEWIIVMKQTQDKYMHLINVVGLPPQAARGILPNDLKTEIVITANLREWRNIFKLRCAADAHPDMHRVMIPLQRELYKLLPDVFE